MLPTSPAPAFDDLVPADDFRLGNPPAAGRLLDERGGVELALQRGSSPRTRLGARHQLVDRRQRRRRRVAA